MSGESQSEFDKIVKALRAPTPPDEVRYLPQSLRDTQGTGTPSALALPYVDARYIQDRLDAACGPLGWQSEVKMMGAILCIGIGIFNPVTSQWVWKWDTGQEEPSDIADSDDDADHSAGAKGVISRGLKRTAVQWGIARDIYDLPKRRRACKVDGRGKFAGWAEPVGASQSTGQGSQTGGSTGNGGGSAEQKKATPDANAKGGPTPEFTRFKLLADRLQLSQMDVNQLLSKMKKDDGKVDYRKAGDQLLTQIPEDERARYAI